MARVYVRKLGYALGAEVTGFDASTPLDDETIAAVRRASLEHIVLCFPGQNLDAEQMKVFCGRFGELDDSRQSPQNSHPDVTAMSIISNKPVTINGKSAGGYSVADKWHSDRQFLNRPTTFSFLLAKQLPDVGGNTMFANTYMAYESLSARFCDMIDPLLAVHDATLGTTFLLNPELREDIKKRNPPVVHPVVKTHPETGRKALYIGYRVRHFVGMTEEETRPLLDFLLQHSTRYEFIYRHTWSLHDLMMWDNRCGIHLAVPDYDTTQTRSMLRCALLGPESGYHYTGTIEPGTVTREDTAAVT